MYHLVNFCDATPLATNAQNRHRHRPLVAVVHGLVTAIACLSALFEARLAGSGMIRPHSSSNSQRSHQSSHSTARGNTVTEGQACAYTGRQPREPICKLPKQETTLIANDNRKSNRVLSYVIPPILVAAAAYSCIHFSNKSFAS
jgi:hypothetical protein